MCQHCTNLNTAGDAFQLTFATGSGDTAGKEVYHWAMIAEGPQGTSPFDLRYHRENGARQPGNERSRPQFTAHNSVRSLKNGLSLGGSSATRPLSRGGGRTFYAQNAGDSDAWPVVDGGTAYRRPSCGVVPRRVLLGTPFFRVGNRK